MRLLSRQVARAGGYPRPQRWRPVACAANRSRRDRSWSRPVPTVQVTILAAGLGTRLKRPMPKPLTPLDDGRTIMAQQVDNVRAVFGDDAQIVIVVGFKHELIMEAVPEALFAYNERYDETNTSKSLLKALRASAD